MVCLSYIDVPYTNVVDRLPTHPNKKYRRRKLKDIKRIVIHADDMGLDVFSIAKYDIQPNHLSKTGAPGFTYHYFIDQDGTIWKTQPEDVITWHVGPFNTTSLGICLSYKATNNPLPPPEVQMTQLVDLIVGLMLRFKIEAPFVVGHRELPGTGYQVIEGKKVLRKTCPGLAIDLAELRGIITKKMQLLLTTVIGEDIIVDGIWGKQTSKAFSKIKI